MQTMNFIISMKKIYSYIFKYKNKFIIENILDHLSYNELIFHIYNFIYSNKLKSISVSMFIENMLIYIGSYSKKNVTNNLNNIIRECEIIFSDEFMIKYIIRQSIKDELIIVMEYQNIKNRYKLQYQNVISEINDEVFRINNI